MSRLYTPVTSTALEHAVGGAHAEFGATMAVDQFWLFTSSTACWMAQGATPVASAGAGSMYVPANTPVMLSGDNGADVSVIQDAVAGKASLVRCMVW